MASPAPRRLTAAESGAIVTAAAVGVRSSVLGSTAMHPDDGGGAAVARSTTEAARRRDPPGSAASAARTRSSIPSGGSGSPASSRLPTRSWSRSPDESLGRSDEGERAVMSGEKPFGVLQPAVTTRRALRPAGVGREPAVLCDGDGGERLVSGNALVDGLEERRDRSSGACRWPGGAGARDTTIARSGGAWKTPQTSVPPAGSGRAPPRGRRAHARRASAAWRTRAARAPTRLRGSPTRARRRGRTLRRRRPPALRGRRAGRSARRGRASRPGGSKSSGAIGCAVRERRRSRQTLRQIVSSHARSAPGRRKRRRLR